MSARIDNLARTMTEPPVALAGGEKTAERRWKRHKYKIRQCLYRQLLAQLPLSPEGKVRNKEFHNF